MFFKKENPIWKGSENSQLPGESRDRGSVIFWKFILFFNKQYVVFGFFKEREN